MFAAFVAVVARRPRARPPPRPARCPRRPACPPSTRGTRASARPRRGTGRCRRQGGARGAPPNTKAANATASTASTAPMITPGGERGQPSPGSSLLGHGPPSTWPNRAGRRTPSTCRSTAPTASSRATGAAPRPARARRPPSARIVAPLSRRTTLGVSATTSAVRGTPRVHRDLADDDAGVHRAQTQPGPLGRHHLHAQPTRLPRRRRRPAGRPVGSARCPRGSVTRSRYVPRPAGMPASAALDPSGDVTRSVRPGRRPSRPGALDHGPVGPGDAEQTFLAPLEPAVQVGFEPDDPLGLDDPAALQLLADRIRRTREHELEPGRSPPGAPP